MDLANRAEIERRLARVLSRDLRNEMGRLLDYLGDPPDLSRVPADYWQNGWRGLQKDVEPILMDVFLQQAEAAMNDVGIGADWAAVNMDASNWARTQGETILKELFNKTYEGVSVTVPKFFEQDWTIGDLSTALERWYSPVRAEMIAVTETTRAAVEGEVAVMRELEKESGLHMVEVWLTSNDEIARKCPVCWPKHGKPIVGGNRPPAHPRCLHEDSLVLPGGGVSAVSKRWYEGDFVTIETLENKLTVTPNHPILTLDGWVAAGDLTEGDNVLGYSGSEWESLIVNANNKNVKTVVKDIFSSFGVDGFRVPTSAPDFHGDGAGSDIAIIRTNGEIVNDWNSRVLQPSSESDFILRNVIEQTPLTELSPETELVKGNVPSSGSIVSSRDLLLALFGRHSAPLDTFGFGLSSYMYSILNETAANDRPADTKLFSKAIFGFSGDITLQKIVKISNFYSSGHVYNLQTDSEMYLANNIITHNCRCMIGWEHVKQ